MQSQRHRNKGEAGLGLGNGNGVWGGYVSEPDCVTQSLHTYTLLLGPNLQGEQHRVFLPPIMYILCILNVSHPHCQTYAQQFPRMFPLCSTYFHTEWKLISRAAKLAYNCMVILFTCGLIFKKSAPALPRNGNGSGSNKNNNTTLRQWIKTRSSRQSLGNSGRCLMDFNIVWK